MNDVFTLSLDSSGTLLYKRGIKQHGGRAPVRETLAAAVLRLAAYRGGMLLDPMCGSGTFTLEAAMMRQNMPPGWHRSFAFEKWPCFRPNRWQYIRKEAAAKIADPEEPGIWSSDRNASDCAALERTLADAGLQNAARVACRDFFDITREDLMHAGIAGRAEPGLLVLNPPYGRRLGSVKGSRTRLSDIMKKISSDFKGWRYAVLAPSASFPKSLPGIGVKRMPVFHGGLKLTLVMGYVAV